MQARTPNSIDIHVGTQIRLRRKSLHITQSDLGERLGITFQQVQKYEKGTNRVGASRLQAIAGILGVDAAFFFNNITGNNPVNAQAHDEADSLRSFVSSNEGFALNQAFYKIRQPRVRQRVLALVKSLAEKPDSVETEAL